MALPGARLGGARRRFVFEPPGEIHTLVVDDAGGDEMITFFNIHGAMVYVDERARTGYEDVHTKIAMCRRHYEACGLGADYVDQFVR